MTIPLSDISRLYEGDAPVITTIDSHTEGEMTRLIVNGLPPVPGASMTEKLIRFKTDHDGIRHLLTREPRGSRQVLAALVTEPVTSDAAFGLIYMDARRYPFLCGHATIGAVTTLFRTGTLALTEGDNRVGIDTPSGRMTALAHVRNGRLTSVSIQWCPRLFLPWISRSGWTILDPSPWTWCVPADFSPWSTHSRSICHPRWKTKKKTGGSGHETH